MEFGLWITARGRWQNRSSQNALYIFLKAVFQIFHENEKIRQKYDSVDCDFFHYISQAQVKASWNEF